MNGTDVTSDVTDWLAARPGAMPSCATATKSAKTTTLKLKASRKKAVNRVTVRGRVAGGEACTGKVVLTVKRGKTIVGRKTAPLKANCRYLTRIKVTGSGGKLKVRATYARTSKTVKVS